MNEQQARTVSILNQLYAAERRSLLPRLGETSAFVSWARAGESAAFGRMIAEENEHIEWLVEAIDREGGVVLPAHPDVHTGHLHYLEIHALLPQVIGSLEKLLATYRRAAAMPLTQPAAGVVARIAGRHQSHLQQLQEFAAESTV